MKYLKTFESTTFWVDKVYQKVTFDKEDDIKELLYSLTDLGFKLSIEKDLRKGKGGTPDKLENSSGKIGDYYDESTNLYKSYYINLDDEKKDNTDINRILEIKENEIELINRLKSIGFKIFYDSGTGLSISLRLYHPDDKIDKKMFMPKHEKNEELIENIQKSFDTIANIFKAKDSITGEPSIVLTLRDKDKYTLDDFHKIVNKFLNGKYKISKKKIYQYDKKPSGLVIKY